MPHSPHVFMEDEMKTKGMVARCKGTKMSHNDPDDDYENLTFLTKLE